MTTTRSNRIDLNMLVALGALLEERNLTHAGNRIGMSQPAMSGILARLRTHFGDELLIRTNRAYELTPLAEEILPTVRTALEAVGGVLKPGAEFDPRTSHRQFSVAISDYAMAVLVPPLLSVLAERAPHVTVDFRPLPPPGEDMITELMRRDFIVAALGFDVPGRHQVLLSDRFVCLVSRSNPLSGNELLTLDDLGKLGHAAGSFGPSAVTPADRLLTELGVDRHVEVTVPGLLPLGFAVAGTDLCAFVPERLARQFCELLDVTVVEVPFSPAKLVEAAHWHPSRAADRGLAFFRDVLMEVSRRVEPPIA